jgi:hypothetical protein
LDKDCCEEAVFAGHVGIFDIVYDPVACAACCKSVRGFRQATCVVRDERGALLADICIVMYDWDRCGAHAECCGSCEELVHMIWVCQRWEFVGQGWRGRDEACIGNMLENKVLEFSVRLLVMSIVRMKEVEVW